MLSHIPAAFKILDLSMGGPGTDLAAGGPRADAREDPAIQARIDGIVRRRQGQAPWHGMDFEGWSC